MSAVLLAALDGIQNKTHPGQPLDKDIYDLSPEEIRQVPSLPTSLDDALEALESRPHLRGRLAKARRRRVVVGREEVEPVVHRWP